MTITGIDRESFALVSGWTYVAGTLVADALTTPSGTRVLQRELGAGHMALVDRPANGETLARVSVAMARALDQIRHRETGAAPLRFRGITPRTIGQDGVTRLTVRLEDLVDDVGAEREIAR
ncbi:hypothetical protein [Phreatobacter stygius]|uniref:Uncharacterized protein n=1 Tax=Phreatobacter stygius TaxID=1940610 RepID=A0A4D7B2L3_9HYPH|nr:hypothetical protein [Phreatobacter stygius]QCI65535.1 hypothetical protein E8M01_15765 [Phreatobacter stygius]